MCVCPDGDFFRVIREGKVTVMTDRIDCFTPTGIKLVDRGEVQTDLIVLATGLDITSAGSPGFMSSQVQVAITE